jgi:predicted CoA-binding protein
MVTSRRQTDEFWGLTRLAVVGVSRDPKHFSYGIWQELRQRRYEAVPVNPNAAEIDGQRCYARVSDIERFVAGT